MNVPLSSGSATNPYITVHRLSDNKFWNGTAFETYAAGNWTTYDIAGTSIGAGEYTAAIPADIDLQIDSYSVVWRSRAGVSPAVGDTILDDLIIGKTAGPELGGASGTLLGEDLLKRTRQILSDETGDRWDAAVLYQYLTDAQVMLADIRTDALVESDGFTVPELADLDDDADASPFAPKWKQALATCAAAKAVGETSQDQNNAAAAGALMNQFYKLAGHPELMNRR